MRRDQWLNAGMVGMAALGVAATGPVPPARAQQRPVRFQKHVVSLGSPFASVVAADVDRDGKQELITAAIEEVNLFTRGARPAFWIKKTLFKQTPQTGTLTSNGIQAFDVDADGDPDIVSHTGGTGHLVWYENPGTPDGAWPRHLIDVLKNPHGTAFEDLDKDGKPELVATQDGSIVWYRIPRKPAGALAGTYTGDAAGRPRWERQYLARSGADGILHHLAFGDINGDGRADVGSGASDGGYFAWWERPADGTQIWTRHAVRNTPGATHLFPGDLNRDGKPDLLLVVGHKKGLSWLAGPAFTEETVIDNEWLDGPHAPALADLDGDGDLDLACTGRANSRVAWFENDGKGRFTRHDLDDAQSGLDCRAVDLDKDGDLDLLLAGEASNNVVWWENLGR